MIVHCFTVRRLYENPVNIETIYAELGTNIPKYLQYEGGSGGNTYLCCVDITVDVKEICKKYAYECDTLYQIEVDEDKYNNFYTIYPTYSRDGAKFALDIVKINSIDDLE